MDCPGNRRGEGSRKGDETAMSKRGIDVSEWNGTLDWEKIRSDGVAFAIISFYMLSLGGKKEGIDFKHNRWIWFAVTASLLGAVSALYDKALMRQLDNMLVQAWCNVYIMLIMCVVMFILWYPKRKEQPFQWRWTILLISLFLTVADFAYFKALSQEGSMISIVSMVRRGNVIISFLCGALFLHEKNIKSKLIALAMVLIGLLFLYFGTR